MLPIKLHLKDIGPYQDETIDFKEVGGCVVAIVGENGAGKTMLMDSIFAALYRYFPSRDSIYKYCRGKNALIELTFQSGVGNEYFSQIKINAVKREMESYLFEVSDAEASVRELVPLTDGKNSTFDAHIKKILGDSEMVLASVFAAQNKAGSFAQLSKAKRKELFIDMLGLSKLQAISDECAAREKVAAAEHERLLDRLQFLEGLAGCDEAELARLQGQLAEARKEVEAADLGVREATIQLGVMKAKASAAKDIEARQFPLRKKRQEVAALQAETNKAIAQTATLANSVDLYRNRAERYADLDRELDHQRKLLSLASADVSLHHKAMSAYQEAAKSLELELRGQRHITSDATSKINRARADAAIIDTVPCHAEGECANCQFLVLASAAKQTLGTLEEDRDNAIAATLALEAQLKELPKPDPAHLAQFEAAFANAQKQVRELEPKLEEANQARSKLILAEAAAGTLENLNVRIQQLDQESSDLDREMEQLERDLVEARQYWDGLRKAEKALELNQEMAEQGRIHLNNLLGDVGKAEAEREQANKAKEEMALMETHLERSFQDSKSWELLSKAFGKTGIQSLEIDSAGPVISEIVNDLLFSCFGPRFSVRFVTQVLKDDKSGYKDDFDIYVTDASTEREGSIDDLSGGEKVIICEALSLALALFNRERGGIGWASIFRDEASSAIDDKRAPLYIKMLRSAREQGHFTKLFFIAHQTRVTAGADSKILVDNGKITLE